MFDTRWTPFARLGTTELYEVLRLRAEVFVVEQACAYQDLDGLDADAHHLLAQDEHGLVAYLRAFPPSPDDAVIGRVIVHPRARGAGAGRWLMIEGQRLVHATWGQCGIRLSAQAHLERFYGSLGYRRAGAGYLEDGIPHLPMKRGLSDGDGEPD